MSIDYEALREDLKQELYGAAFCGGFGGALMEAGDVWIMRSRRNCCEWQETTG